MFWRVVDSGSQSLLLSARDIVTYIHIGLKVTLIARYLKVKSRVFRKCGTRFICNAMFVFAWTPHNATIQHEVLLGVQYRDI